VTGSGRRERGVDSRGERASRRASPRIGDLAGLCVGVAVAALLACVCAAPARASADEGGPFGIASFSMQTTRTREVAHGPGIPGDGFSEEPYAFTQAAGHPYALTSEVGFDSEEVGEDHKVVPTRNPKDVVIDLPPGLVADAQAVPLCSTPRLLAGTACPSDTQVGVFVLHDGSGVLFGPVVDLTPERGVAAELGLETAASGPSFLLDGQLVRTARGYGLALAANGLPPLGVTGMQVTLWGVPGDAGHDPQRGFFCNGSEGNQPWDCTGGGVAYGGSPAPFLTMPAACAAGPDSASVRADSWEEPGRWVRAQATLPGVTGCNLLGFGPSLQARPETGLADEPLGLGLDVEAPQSEGVQAAATPPLRDATVTLPQGVSLSAAVADGLQACPASGPEGIDMPTGLGASGEPLQPGELGEGEEVGPNEQPRLAPGHCPPASTVGAAEALTPLLAHPLEGRVYLASPGCGGPGQMQCTEEDAADGNLYRMYIELGGRGDPHDEGVDIKLEGRVQANPATGQLSVQLMDLPQLPLSRLSINLDGGPHALLDSPATCGPATTTSDLRPWSAPGSTPEGLLMAGTPDATPSSFYEVTGCAGAGAFHPGFLAGTLTPQAGAFSAFTFSVTRGDREQYLDGIQLRAPPGLSAMLSSVPLCPEALANTGHCPAASRIGSTLIASGAGSHPFQMGGSVYLTGGYEGAPFGLSIVTDAAAGPLNLGLMVIRARIDIDPRTAALTITSDSLPQIVLGVPLRLQRVSIEIDRPGGAPFIFNPTNCAAMTVAATIASTAGSGAAVSSPFAAAGCKDLKFTPKLTALTRANGEFQGHGASLHVVIITGTPSSISTSASTSRATSTPTETAQANMRALKLDLPQRLPARLETIRRACPESTFTQNPAACPKASVIGQASVRTPILAATMTGPAYLVAKSGSGTSHPGESKLEREEAAFPNMILVLQADGVRIDLTGGLFVSEKNITSVVFRTIPDVPIRRLDLILPEGKTSILAASSGLCTKKPLRMATAITGQNGARVKRGVTVAVMGCPPTRKHERPKKQPKRHKPKRRAGKR